MGPASTAKSGHNPKATSAPDSGLSLRQKITTQATQIEKFIKPKWKDLIEMKQNLKDADSAIQYLIDQQYLEESMDVTLDIMSYILMLLSVSPHTKVVHEGARAIALILKEASKITREEAVSEKIEAALTPVMTEIVTMKMEIIATVENAKETEAPREHPMNTYANATKRQEKDVTRTSSDIKNRQVLIDKEPDTESDPFADLTEAQLVGKANEAIQMAQIDEGTKKTQIISARRLQNGGILLKANSIETARRIRSEKDEFCKFFSPFAIVKERIYPVKIKFVPVTHDTTSEWELRRIEENSSMEKGQIIGTTWIKPAERRSKGQQVALLIARFKSPEAANLAIQNGLVIQGRRVFGYKPMNGPIRCFHCQGYRHFAAICPHKEKAMKCATCTGPHKREQCPEQDQQKYRCPNCNQQGHAAWDPECTIYKAQLEKTVNSNIEAQFKYYRTNDRWTWERDPIMEPKTGETRTMRTERAVDQQDKEYELEQEEGEVTEIEEQMTRKTKIARIGTQTQSTLDRFITRSDPELGEEEDYRTQ